MLGQTSGENQAMCKRILVITIVLAGLCGGRANSAETDAVKKPVEATYRIDRDLVYAQPGGQRLLADAFIPNAPGPHPGVLVVHGGGWMSGGRTQLNRVAEMLAEADYTAVAINYRLAPKHTFPAQIEDCREAVAWMRQNAERLEIDPTRIGAFGYSAGGQLVALLGTTDGTENSPSEQDVKTDAPIDDDGGQTKVDTSIKAFVAGGAPCDFRYIPPKAKYLAFWLGGTREEKPEQYELASPAVFVTPGDAPGFFYHGTNDKVVPMISSVGMVFVMRRAGVPAEIHRVVDAGHIPAAHDVPATQAGIEFFDRYLRDDPRAKKDESKAATPET